MLEENCYYVGSMGLSRSCDIYSMDNSGSVSEYNFNEIKDYDVLYMKADKIPEFYRNMNFLNAKVVLVTGRSDYTMPDHLLSIDDFHKLINSDKILHWYCQNCIIKHDKITNLPIGLDYHTLKDGLNNSWGPQASPHAQEMQIALINKTSKPFWERIKLGCSNFHFSIQDIYENDRKDSVLQIPNDCIYYEEGKLNRYDTWKKMSNYTFIISQHSNGLDCHRTWEALVLGCIVIVKTSQLDKMYENLPVIIVNNWGDINKEFLENKCNEFKNLHEKNYFKYEKLTLSYWVKQFNSFKPKNKEIEKLESAVFISHAGLGDNIISISALEFLLDYYKKIYFICKTNNLKHINYLFQNRNEIIPIQFGERDFEYEKNFCTEFVNSKINDSDIFICGYHKSYLKSKITHNLLINRKIDHKGYRMPQKYIDFTWFYEDINLDLYIFAKYFKINYSKEVIEIYKNISSLGYKIIFTHTEASDKKIDLYNTISNYILSDEYIVISANENYYGEVNPKHQIAKQFIKLPTIIHYTEIIKNADAIYVVDSCLSCIVVGLHFSNQLKTNEIYIYERHHGYLLDLDK